MLSRFTGGAGALFQVFLQVFSSEFPEGRLEVFIMVFSCFWVSLGGLLLSIFRKNITFFQKVSTPVFCIEYSVLV